LFYIIMFLGFFCPRARQKKRHTIRKSTMLPQAKAL
jgi:hypothetical protein